MANNPLLLNQFEISVLKGEAPAMICPDCGTTNSDKAQSCRQCGKSLSRPEPKPPWVSPLKAALLCAGVMVLVILVMLPGFLASSRRSRVAQVKSIQRMFTPALEAYYLDLNKPAPSGAAPAPTTSTASSHATGSIPGKPLIHAPNPAVPSIWLIGLTYDPSNGTASGTGVYRYKQ